MKIIHLVENANCFYFEENQINICENLDKNQINSYLRLEKEKTYSKIEELNWI